MVKIIINGFLGKMGSLICQLAKENPNCEIVAAIDANLHAPVEPFPTFYNIEECDMPADVIIDFSTAKAVNKLLDYAVNKKIPIVLCTTGLDEDTVNKINEASKKIAIFQSFNMSLGVNLISEVVKKISKALYNANFDIEIIERHHNQKIDAPSGTALMLADSINSSLNNKLEYIYDRSNITEKRERKQIGIHSLRGGNIVGDHSIIFAGKDEIIEIKHSAISKEIFAVGAINAAIYLKNKSPQIYNMKNLMSEVI